MLAPQRGHDVGGESPPTLPRRTVVSLGVAAAIVVYLLSVVGTAELAPPHALVLDDARTRTYTTPACASTLPANAPPLTRTTKRAADARGHAPDPECWRNGGFLGRGSSRWEQLLAKLRLNRVGRESRWRPDGSWRW
ncbi:MAG TPA: hypothetical protein VEA99_01345 [Gemmatimonadaceae bacterium]|nr:hypothetical protein [Gemmatimonadaceae bacterium]